MAEEFNKLGYLDLLNKQRSKPKVPNQIKPGKEQIICNYMLNYPRHGSERIANELVTQGTTISPYGVRNVLKRKILSRHLDRLFYAQKCSDNPVILKHHLRE